MLSRKPWGTLIYVGTSLMRASQIVAKFNVPALKKCLILSVVEADRGELKGN